MTPIPHKLFGAVTMCLLLSLDPAPAETLFSHTFDEGTGGLNGTPVDVGTGSWVAFGGVNANGEFNSDTGNGPTSGGSATLAFSPSNGFEYTLDARILNVTGDANWVALGFANGQIATPSSFHRFITGSATVPGVVGTAWMFVRGNNDPNANVAHNGTGELGSGNGGLADGVDWTALNNNGGSIDLRILLDTTGGTANWTVTWLAKLTTDVTYTTVRPTTVVPVANEANYTSVGFAFSSNAIDGVLESFSLSTSEPADSFDLTITPAVSPASGFDLEWESQPGKLYNLRTSTDLGGPISSWSLVEGDIAATPPANVKNVPPDGARRFYAVEEFDAPPPPPILATGFESDNGGFTVVTTGTGSAWEYGQPNSPDQGGGFAVTTGNGGSARCWGVNLAGPYAADTATSLRSSAINLSGLAEGAGAELAFALATDMASDSDLEVRVIEEATDTVVGASLHSITGLNATNWSVLGPFALPAEAIGTTVRIEWRFTGPTDSPAFLGAFVDDVEIREN